MRIDGRQNASLVSSPEMAFGLWRCIASIVLVVFFASNALAGETPFSESTEHIAEIPENAVIVPESVRPRPHLGKIAYVYQDHEGFSVCINDDCGPRVEQVMRGMPQVSPDGKHVAAVVQKNEKASVMLSGSTSRGYDMVYALAFSPDSMKLAYIATEDEQFFVYVNQERHPEFAAIDPGEGLVFSRDSGNLAYIASPGGDSWVLVKNGEPGDEFEEIKHVTFSRDSTRLAYAVRQDGRWHVMENGEKEDGDEDITHVAYCPQSETLAYIARKARGSVMVINGEESEAFDHIPGEPSFCNDGERLAYAVAEERRGDIKMRMVADNEVGPIFDRIGAYLFSPDGKQFVYMAEKDEKGRIVHNGNKHKEFDSVGLPVFSHDGRMAYTVYRDGKWAVKEGGEIGPEFDKVENPIFCPNGDRMVYLAEMGGQYMVVEDGEIIGSHQWAGQLRFSPDGDHLVYAAAEDGESFLVVDGEKGEERFLSFLRGSPLVFVEDNVVQAIGLREEGREFHLLRAEIGK